MTSSVIAVTIVVVAASLIILRKYNKHIWGKCTNLQNMTGKTVVITGANSGLGKATAEEMAKLGAHVILACRNITRGKLAADEIRQRTQNGVLKVSELDLASFESIQRFVEEFRNNESRLDVLINNAGVFSHCIPRTQEGFEPHFGINHIGHFLLTNMLLEIIKQSTPSRIVIITSYLYKKGSINIDCINCTPSSSSEVKKAYYDSKLANIFFSQELAKRLERSEVNVYAVSPGLTYTNLGRHMKGKWWKMILFAPIAFIFLRTARQGCQTILQCAASADVKEETGLFYRNCKKCELLEFAKDDVTAKQLWDYSERCIENRRNTSY